MRCKQRHRSAFITARRHLTATRSPRAGTLPGPAPHPVLAREQSHSRNFPSKRSPMNDDTPPDDPTAPDDPMAAIESSRLGPAMKTALRLVAEGQSYRQAAKEANLQSTADLRRAAKRFGLAQVHNRARRAVVAEEREWRTSELIESMRQIAGKGAQELLRRLEE